MIGLILGDTDFPNEILKKVKKKNLKYLIIDFSVTKKFCNRINSYNISIGQFGKIIRTLKKINVKKFYLQVKLKNRNYLS